MEQKHFFTSLKETRFNDERIKEIEHIYHHELPEIVKRIVSSNDQSVLIEPGKRLLSYAEIKNADEWLETDFQGLQMIPVFDFYDNDFLVYCFNTDTWGLFNIIEGVLFDEKYDERFFCWRVILKIK